MMMVRRVLYYSKVCHQTPPVLYLGTSLSYQISSKLPGPHQPSPLMGHTCLLPYLDYGDILSIGSCWGNSSDSFCSLLL